MSPRVAASAAVAAVVVAVAVPASAHSGGIPIQPYQFVAPPKEVATTNVPPVPLIKTIPFVTRRGQDGNDVTVFQGGTVTDPQVAISVPSVVFAVEPLQDDVRLTITPVDPSTLGDPPSGQTYEGNAIRLEAVYEPSLEPAVPVAQDCSLGGCMTLILRYPYLADRIYRLDPSGWIELEGAKQVGSSAQIYAPILETGTFVATSPPGTMTPSATKKALPYALGAIVVIAVMVGNGIRLRTSRAKPGGAAKKRR